MARSPTTGCGFRSSTSTRAITNANAKARRPDRCHWAKIVERDLAQTAGIRVEVIPTREEAEQLIKAGKRAAVLVFGPKFSERMTRSSFLPGGVNPLFRDGVKIEELDAHLLRDPTQMTAASIIEQVGQVTMLRVVLPWMIGRAFEKIGDQLGSIVPSALGKMFPNYNLTGKTWAALVRSDPRADQGADVSVYEPPSGSGLLDRGAHALPDSRAFLHGDVRLFPGADRRLVVCRRAPAGNAQAPAGRSAFSQRDPAGQAAPLLFALARRKDCSCSAPASSCSP